LHLLDWLEYANIVLQVAPCLCHCIAVY
jgi:hypothetical protein